MTSEGSGAGKGGIGRTTGEVELTARVITLVGDGGNGG